MKIFLALAGILVMTQAGAQEPLRLYAAGSLRGAMTEIAARFESARGVKVAATFGASGLLRERIEKGERADVFASADMGHPSRLANAGRAAPVRRFARNQLCALVSPRVEASREDLLERMLDPRIRLGTSTPKADPSGDYAWELFDKAERARAGSFRILSEKALKLTGSADSPAPPPDRSVYGMLVAEGKADIFLTYCTNSIQAQKEHPSLRAVQVPAALAVGAEYGLTVMQGAGAAAEGFADFVLSREGQEILQRHGFGGAE